PLFPAAIHALVPGAPLESVVEDDSAVGQMPPGAVHLPIEGVLPSFDGAITWLNSPPLTPSDLRGKVVLVDFWTYTCINWLRTLGYVSAWAQKYEDRGLVVIGVHTPEFPFERRVDNVRWAVQEDGIDYPVALDSRYGVSERAQSFASPGRPGVDESRQYELPDALRLNQWALAGEWAIERGASVLSGAEGRLAFCFHARDVNVVLGPPARGMMSVPFR